MSDTSRRHVLRTLATMPLMGGAVASLPNRDAEILAIEAQLPGLKAQAKEISRTRVEPFTAALEDTFYRNAWRLPEKARWDAVCAYSKAVGYEQAVDDRDAIKDRICNLIEQMIAISAFGPEGKAAKVRVLLRYVAPEMSGRSDDMEWDRDMTRMVLAEYAGISRDEMVTI